MGSQRSCLCMWCIHILSIRWRLYCTPDSPCIAHQVAPVLCIRRGFRTTRPPSWHSLPPHPRACQLPPVGVQVRDFGLGFEFGFGSGFGLGFGLDFYHVRCLHNGFLNEVIRDSVYDLRVRAGVGVRVNASQCHSVYDPQHCIPSFGLAECSASTCN